jgi:hypothetical protein
MNTNPFPALHAASPRRGLTLAALVATLMAGPALAQSNAMATAPAAAMPVSAQSPGPGPGVDGGATPSQIMVVNLIHLLVKQGVLTQQAADGLIKQAEDEAAQARVAAASAPLSASSLPPPAPGVVRVPYVPEVVRNQIRDEIKQDVMAQAQTEGWANKNVIPDWINRIHWSGDFRFRDQFNFYSPNNIGANNQPGMIDYATFNSNGPTDINPNTNPNGIPFLNTLNNRINQLSIRARLAMTADIYNGISATVRVASGNDNSPVSTTQLLGGGFTKDDFWLDQAFITLAPVSWASANFGRMPNPFMYTSLVWDDNLNFDGAALKASRDFGPEGLTVFGSGGAFPIGYVGTNFPTDSSEKAADRSKWLFAAQLGAAYKPDPDGWSVRAAVAYYDYQNIEGELSQPCAIYSGVKQCSTDFTAPAFMQKGNTLFLLREIIPNPSSPLNYAQPQLLGLSYSYRILDVVEQVDMPLFGKNHLVLAGDYARNLAYDPARILSNPLIQPVNNYESTESGDLGPYHSGNNAWLVQATVGNPKPGAPGDWGVTVGYRYIEPDAVLDAFNDHDFHLGGTNAKGYYVSASYFFANNTWVDGRWFSANQVDGPPLAIDVLQLELNTRF